MVNFINPGGAKPGLFFFFLTFGINSRLCMGLQCEYISLLEFKRDISDWNKMWYFSLVHKLHTLDTGEKGVPRSKIFQFRSKSMFWLFSSWMWLLNEVWPISLFLKVCLCPASLCLNSVDVLPMYEFFSPFDWITVAWYIIFFSKHFPSMGQGVSFLQLHVLGGCSSFLKILAFFPAIILWMLGVLL